MNARQGSVVASLAHEDLTIWEAPLKLDKRAGNQVSKENVVLCACGAPVMSIEGIPNCWV